ncbi:mitochondrial ribosomal protein L25 (bL25m) [Andalucia godoyi]|uniref:Mitochondrial ribosomal protein L25 (BL25m) n=1 Tax=Andalucia godoyi TaxID=505711 RepID=A0A8K0F4A1_ANDGO|nr:mitochondrial ribosomal protein L25 (bL25m) [Andalucia godoyi]|eukprot:ANDGO_08548.mRNA.1 mitochondrial ribosomal protein L25 (bL25m)
MVCRDRYRVYRVLQEWDKTLGWACTKYRESPYSKRGSSDRERQLTVVGTLEKSFKPGFRTLFIFVLVVATPTQNKGRVDSEKRPPYTSDGFYITLTWLERYCIPSQKMTSLVRRSVMRLFSSTPAAAESPSILTLTAQIRDASGSRAARKLRATGRVPGIVFGGPDGKPAALISLSEDEVEHKLAASPWANPQATLRIEGQADQTVGVHQIIRHPVSRKLASLNLLRE